jgi:hypothetical protein
LVDFFSQTHLVTLLSIQTQARSIVMQMRDLKKLQKRDLSKKIWT